MFDCLHLSGLGLMESGMETGEDGGHLSSQTLTEHGDGTEQSWEILLLVMRWLLLSSVINGRCLSHTFRLLCK